MSMAKKTEMTGAKQDALHPDAELLSAFAERALGRHERDRVLLHLAACGRCRQVVALAQQAPGMEAMKQDEVELEETALPAAAGVGAPRSAPIRAGAWWTKWRLVWVPTAVVAALAVTSIAVYLRQADKNEMTVSVATRAAPPVAGPGPGPSATEQAEAAPPAGASTALHPETPAGREQTQGQARKPAIAAAPPPPAATRRVPAPSHSAGSRMFAAMPTEAPPPTATETVQVAQDRNGPETVDTAKLTPIEPQVQAQSQALLKSPGPAADKKQSRGELREGVVAGNLESEGATAQDQLTAANGQPAPVAPAAGTATPAGAYRQPVESRAAPAASFSRLRGTGVAKVPAIGATTQLPSGLNILSMASAGHLRIAIDKANTVFLSENSGANWRRIAPQWTGRAVLVRAQPFPMPAATAGANRTTQVEPAGGTSAAPMALFEIVNDKNQVFESADGITWVAK